MIKTLIKLLFILILFSISTVIILSFTIPLNHVFQSQWNQDLSIYNNKIYKGTRGILFNLLNETFTEIINHNLTAFITDGSLLSIYRYNQIIFPWDSDIEITLWSDKDEEIFYNKVIPKLNKKNITIGKDKDYIIFNGKNLPRLEVSKYKRVDSKAWNGF